MPDTPIHALQQAETAAILDAVPGTHSDAAAAYLASLAAGASRNSMRSALDTAARILTGDAEAVALSTPWAALTAAHLDALRSRLMEAYAPATANKTLSAVRGVVRAAWKLERISTDAYMRLAAVENVKGSRLPAGRALAVGELRALFETCAADPSPAGARDAAALALMFGAGLRRGEAVAVHLADYDPEAGAITITGKGNRQRLVYASNGGKAALDAWTARRGDFEGALLAPVNKAGQVLKRAMSAQALMNRLKLRSRQAQIAPCSPHDLRRTFVSELLDAGADISAVQRLAGHASPRTTARYDRRGNRAMQRAAAMLHVPFVES